MFEIELKAHVADRKSTAQKISAFAEFDRFISKEDNYYRLDKADGNHITARIRKEKLFSCRDTIEFTDKTPCGSSIVLTYKRKELRAGQNGKPIEVNDEKETVLSDPDAVISLLEDSEFKKYIYKKKEAAGWYYDTPCGKAHIELCDVSELGDFIEVEIIACDSDSETVSKIRAQIEKIIEKAGIPLDQIEERYYSEMLSEKNKLMR